MALLSLALYGSRARQDDDASSDVDLFAISDEQKYSMFVKNNTNVASYPRQLAFERAKEGDLFMLHIVSESRALYDPNDEMGQLKNAFAFKQSYDDEISFASDIGWMLVEHSNISNNYAFVNRRIAWCVRTILIGRAASERLPIFAANKLSEFSGSNLTLPLIKGKNSNTPRDDALRNLRKFLIKFGKEHPLESRPALLEDYGRYFAASNNVMGRKTLGFLESVADDFYV
jgi:hypothetical protein